MVKVVAARPLPGHPMDPLGVMVSPDVWDALGLGPEPAVHLRSFMERDAYALAVCAPATSQGQAADLGLVRLGRLLWPQLAVRPGQTANVEVSPAPPAQRVVLTPPFHLSHHLGDHVIQAAREQRSVLWRGAKLFFPVFPGGGGVVVQVAETDASPGRFDADTGIDFAEPDPAVARLPVGFAEIGGLGATIRRLREMVELPLLRPALFQSLGIRPPKGVLLYGPPGTGKTLLSRALATELQANVISLSAPELVGTYSGETEANLRKLFSEAAHHAPSLIIIDEIDVLATSRDRLASQGDIRSATQLLSLMDGLAEVDGIVVVATTNRIDAVDEAFRRPGRFDEEIYVGPPGSAGRLEILRVHTREMPLTEPAEDALRDIAASRTSGFTGADLMHLAREVGLSAARRVTGDRGGFEVAQALQLTDLSIEANDFWDALGRVRPSALRQLQADEPELDWDRIAGLADVKRSLLAAAERSFSSGGGRADGVLLSGPPGNGKTALVQALAHRMHANLVRVDGTTVFTQWLGESEAALRALFTKARQVAPAILAIEHLDAIAPRRSAAEGEQASRRVLAALLSSMDETTARSGVLVVGLTNRADLIDPAVLRTGRLGQHLEVPAPDEHARLALIQVAFGAAEPGADETDMLVRATSGLSAADVLRYARDALPVGGIVANPLNTAGHL